MVWPVVNQHNIPERPHPVNQRFNDMCGTCADKGEAESHHLSHGVQAGRVPKLRISGKDLRSLWNGTVLFKERLEPGWVLQDVRHSFSTKPRVLFLTQAYRVQDSSELTVAIPWDGNPMAWLIQRGQSGCCHGIPVLKIRYRKKALAEAFLEVAGVQGLQGESMFKAVRVVLGVNTCKINGTHGQGRNGRSLCRSLWQHDRGQAGVAPLKSN
jgi:hypothetical protein